MIDRRSCKHGETRRSWEALRFERAGATFVVPDVEARVCTHCGAPLVDGEVAARWRRVIEEALN